MDRKPRLLFLAYYFPPLQVSASVRAANVAHHLSRRGWDVSVVTPHPDLWQSPEDPERVAAEMARCGVRMIYSGHRWRCLSSDYLKRAYDRGGRWLLEGVPRRLAKTLGIEEMVGWYPEAERACAFLRPGEVDLVLATGTPFGAFRLAKRFSQRLRCPYVLDYRDLWSGGPYVDIPPQVQRLERELLEGCAAATVGSPAMAECLQGRFGMAEKIHVVPNGYGPQDFDGIVPMSFDHFGIVYAGIFIPPKINADPLMRTLRRLAQLRPEPAWRFHYFGPHNEHVDEAARRYGVEDRVQLHGLVPRRECLAAVRGAGAAAVVTTSDGADVAQRSIIPAKIYEAIGLGTPVLALVPPGSDVEAVVRTAGKGACFAASQSDAAADYLAGLMAGKTPPSAEPEAYSWSRLVGLLDQVLHSARRPN